MEKVNVLMSTYNGATYVQEQLNSIFSQQGVEVVLSVRDDGSSDDTVEILRQYQAEGYPIKIIEGENKGPAQSFLDLMTNAEFCKYYALADQDDIWQPEKLRIAIDMLEAHQGPCLYYSALCLFGVEGIKVEDKIVVPQLITHDNYIFSYYVTGCTVVYNCELAYIIKKFKPKDIYMHDAWIASLATLFGTCILDKEPHIMYRQHRKNAVGMWRKQMFLEKAVNYIKNNDKRHQNMAKALYSGFGDELAHEDRLLLEEILDYDKTVAAKLKLLFDTRIWKLTSEDRNACLRAILCNKF